MTEHLLWLLTELSESPGQLSRAAAGTADTETSVTLVTCPLTVTRDTWPCSSPASTCGWPRCSSRPSRRRWTPPPTSPCASSAWGSAGPAPCPPGELWLVDSGHVTSVLLSHWSMSGRLALAKLLGGKIYHGYESDMDDRADFWLRWATICFSCFHFVIISLFIQISLLE